MPNEAGKLPHVVIIGGGFGGLAVARKLRKQPVRITLIDKSNHHLFQPLLYQVATAILSPGQIAAPLRQILSSNPNAMVAMGEVTGVNLAAQQVVVSTPDKPDAHVPYDFLVIATGVSHSYFGRDEFAEYAPGLKTLADATDVRNKVLQAFETAEVETDPKHQRELLTFVLVGGGPTGVEMAGAIAELARLTMRRDFRRIDPQKARIILVDAGPRLLSTFDQGLSQETTERLKKMGVEVITGKMVKQIDETGVTVDGEKIFSRTVIWTAGVAPTPAAKWLDAPTDRAGRIVVNQDCTVTSHPNVFAIGDVVSFEQDGTPLPGVAQVAIQQGKYVADVIAARLKEHVSVSPFRYDNRGAMAVVGRNFAVYQKDGAKFSGYLAWLAWCLIHVSFLALPNLRASVFLSWIWSYFSRQRGSRLIVVRHESEAGLHAHASPSGVGSGASVAPGQQRP